MAATSPGTWWPRAIPCIPRSAPCCPSRWTGSRNRNGRCILPCSFLPDRKGKLPGGHATRQIMCGGAMRWWRKARKGCYCGDRLRRRCSQRNGCAGKELCETLLADSTRQKTQDPDQEGLHDGALVIYFGVAR